MENQAKRFEMVLFDIDGVMLSEERYFDGSALTVYELLCSPQYLHASSPALPSFRTQFTDEEIAHIRRATFVDDSIFETVKKRGVNANWDMVYLQTAFHVVKALEHIKGKGHDTVVARILSAAAEGGWTREVIAALGREVSAGGPTFALDFAEFNRVMQPCKTKADLFDRLEGLLVEVAGSGAAPFGANHALWHVCQQTFQEWYLGDEYVSDTRQPGKHGFLSDEVPIVDPAALKHLFAAIKNTGATIGIATGRPELETTIPLQFFGWLEEFDISRVSTASDVLIAERAVPNAAPLAKPNPFSYLRSYLAATDPARVLDYALPLDADHGRQTLIVGDSIADLLAARSMGCQFAAVLTGLEGERARAQFEARQADYILGDVLELSSVLRLI